MSPATARITLTRLQTERTEQARIVLEASVASNDPDHLARHCGALEYRLEDLLKLITELTQQ